MSDAVYVYELDLAMTVFETLNPALYKEYKQARAIRNTGALPFPKSSP